MEGASLSAYLHLEISEILEFSAPVW
jgi:hypothetical protein